MTVVLGFLLVVMVTARCNVYHYMVILIKYDI